MQYIKILLILVVKSLVHRMEHTRDTRAKNVFLTDKGAALVQQLIPVVEAIDAQFFGKISITDQTLLITLLGRLAE